MRVHRTHRPSKIAAGAAVLSIATVAAGCGADPVAEEPLAATTVETTAVETTAVDTTAVVTDSAVTIDDAIVDDLVFLREEERLAGDVYETLGDLWGVKVFDNIAESEDRHTDAVLGLLDTYGIDDPATGMAVGEYNDPVLQDLYDELIALGTQSLTDALTVGATIEDLDIVDLRERASGIDAIDTVLANLEKGSMNHLAAFVGQLERRDETYTAQYLTQAEVDAIVNA